MADIPNDFSSCEICGAAEHLDELPIAIQVDEDNLISNRVIVCMRCFTMYPDNRILLLQVQENRLRKLELEDGE